jgi:hypothetical protein
VSTENARLKVVLGKSLVKPWSLLAAAMLCKLLWLNNLLQWELMLKLGNSTLVVFSRTAEQALIMMF